MSEVTIMFLTFGFPRKQVKMLPDALGYGNCQSRINTSVEFTMLSLNIAEHIPDHGNTQRKQDAGDLRIKWNPLCNYS
jgi:hypothetical protein